MVLPGLHGASGGAKFIVALGRQLDLLRLNLRPACTKVREMTGKAAVA